MLAAYDIDTAFEVLSRAWGIQGLISEKARREIMAWANACSRSFQFDPTRGADPEAVHEMDVELLKRQETLLADLGKGHTELEQLAEEILAQRKSTQQELEATRKTLA